MNKSRGFRVGAGPTLGLVVLLFGRTWAANPATSEPSYAEGALRIQSVGDGDARAWTATCSGELCSRDLGGDTERRVFVGGPFRTGTCVVPFDRLRNCGLDGDVVRDVLPDGLAAAVLLVVPRLWAERLARGDRPDSRRGRSRFVVRKTTCGAEVGLAEAECLVEATGPVAWTNVELTDAVLPARVSPDPSFSSLWIPGVIMAGTMSRVDTRRVPDALSFWGLGASPILYGHRGGAGRDCGRAYSLDRHGRLRGFGDRGRFLVAIDGGLALRLETFLEGSAYRCGTGLGAILSWDLRRGLSGDLGDSWRPDEVRIWRESGRGGD